MWRDINRRFRGLKWTWCIIWSWAWVLTSLIYGVFLIINDSDLYLPIIVHSWTLNSLLMALSLWPSSKTLLYISGTSQLLIQTIKSPQLNKTSIWPVLTSLETSLVSSQEDDQDTSFCGRLMISSQEDIFIDESIDCLKGSIQSRKSNSLVILNELQYWVKEYS